MLKTFRSRISGLFAKFLIALLVLSFGLWGIGDMVRQGGRKISIAQVGDKAISITAYQRELQLAAANIRAQLGSDFSPEMMQTFGIDRQVLEQMITRELFLKESQALGLIPDEKTIAENIRNNAMFRSKEGAFDAQKFHVFLRQNGLSERDYIKTLSHQISSSLLTDAITANAPVLDAQVQTIAAILQEKRVADIYVIPALLAQEIAAPKAEELEAFYKAHPDNFTAPAYRTLDYLAFNADGEKAEKISHQLEDLLAGGATPEEAAKSLQLHIKRIGPIDRQGTGPDGKKIQEPDLSPKVLELAFQTNPGDDSAIISDKKSEYFMVRVTEETPAKSKPFENVRAEVASAWKKEAESRQLQKLAQTIAESFKDPANREKLVKQHRLKSTSSGALLRERTKTASGLSLPSPLMAELFTLGINASTKAYLSSNGDYLIAVLRERVSAPKDAAETDKTLKPALEHQAQGELMQQYAEYLRKKYTVTIDDEALSNLRQSRQRD